MGKKGDANGGKMAPFPHWWRTQEESPTGISHIDCDDQKTWRNLCRLILTGYEWFWRWISRGYPLSEERKGNGYYGDPSDWFISEMGRCVWRLGAKVENAVVGEGTQNARMTSFHVKDLDMDATQKCRMQFVKRWAQTFRSRCTLWGQPLKRLRNQSDAFF